MVEAVQLVRVEIHPALGIANEGVVRPAVPEPGDHLIELPRPGITLVMGEGLLQAEVQRGIGVGGGDDIPAGATVAQMIEGSETPGDMKRLVVGGRGRRHQADVFGGLAEGGQQGEGFERGGGMAAFQGLDGHVEQGQVVGHEKRIETRPLQGLGETLEVGEVEVGVAIGARVAPGAGVNADRAHEGAQLELALGRHGKLLVTAPGSEDPQHRPGKLGLSNNQRCWLMPL
ncbi:hypothetical protein PCAU_3475 [Pseudomonas chlororaphis subsp. aurantiaca]|nr:hypothetical protein PCAU_3475 [Pseudomonas chlororaphis subsp. aurantiaca]